MTALTLILAGALPILALEGILWLLFRRRIKEISFPRPEDQDAFHARNLRSAGLFTLIHVTVVSILMACTLPAFW